MANYASVQYGTGAGPRERSGSCCGQDQTQKEHGIVSAATPPRKLPLPPVIEYLEVLSIETVNEMNTVVVFPEVTRVSE